MTSKGETGYVSYVKLAILKWKLGLLTALLPLVLPVGGQGEERQLGIEVELSFSAASAPELSLSLTAQRDGFQGRLHVTRPLAQSPSWKLSLAESLQLGELTLGAEAGWASSGYSLELGVEGRARAQDARIALQLKLDSLGSTTWVLQGQGTLAPWGLPLRGKIAQLEWGGTRVRVQGLELLWEPTPSLSVTLGYSGEKPLPLRVEIRQALPQGSAARGEVRLASGESGWAWRELQLQWTKGRLSGGALLDPEGWREAWIEQRIRLRAPGEGEGFSDGFTLDLRKREIWGKLRWGPEGWRGTELGGRWEDPLGGALEGTVDLSAGGWSLNGNGRYLSPSLTLQGQWGYGPAGLSQLLLLGQGSLDELSISGMFHHTGSLWFLDLSGSVDFRAWELSGASSWSSLLGWEQATLGIGRRIVVQEVTRGR